MFALGEIVSWRQSDIAVQKGQEIDEAVDRLNALRGPLPSAWDPKHTTHRNPHAEMVAQATREAADAEHAYEMAHARHYAGQPVDLGAAEAAVIAARMALDRAERLPAVLAAAVDLKRAEVLPACREPMAAEARQLVDGFNAVVSKLMKGFAAAVGPLEELDKLLTRAEADFSYPNPSINAFVQVRPFTRPQINLVALRTWLDAMREKGW